jgi:hypothetical protein
MIYILGVKKTKETSRENGKFTGYEKKNGMPPYARYLS